VLIPRRSAAKTLVAKAVRVAGAPTDGQDPATVLAEALSALDRAAKVGAIHPNAAARRKSRLVRKVNAELGGAKVVAGAHVAKQTSKAQAAKEAKARIAAGRATKAKGAQTAAGKARAALSRTTRTEATESAPPAATEAPKKTPATRSRSTAAKTAAKPAARPAAKKAPKS
jgi:ribosomal protein S20